MERVLYITHNNNDVTLQISEGVCTASTNDGDIFFHFEFDDESVNPKSEIVDEFGEDVYNELMN